jgi:hypothetical protein
VQTTASFAISASWHFLILMVLALSVHPPRLPPEPPPVEVELLPPLVTPPPPELTPKPLPPEPIELKERLRREPTVLDKPIELKKSTAAPPKLLDLKLPPAPTPPAPTPPAPLESARPLAPALSRPLEVQNRAAPAKPVQVQQSLNVPQPTAPAEEAPAPTPAPPSVQVLTNQQVIQAPVAITPPAKSANPALRNTLAGAPDLPPPPGGGPAGGGGSTGALPPGAVPGNANAFNGKINGFEAGGGLRMTLGCLNPETYHLTPVERAACLARAAQMAKDAKPMGPNIATAKQAEFDRLRACHAATDLRGAALPSSSGGGGAGTIAGLGSQPRLRDCGPGDR